MNCLGCLVGIRWYYRRKQIYDSRNAGLVYQRAQSSKCDRDSLNQISYK